MKISHAVIAFLFTILLLQCSNSKVEQSHSTLFMAKKINGVSFVSPSNEIGMEEIKIPKVILKANYLSIMPYGFVRDGSTNLVFNSDWQWWGEKSEGTTKMIELAHSQGYQVMLKPHVWKKHGAFTGEHTHETIENWEAFEKSYSNYILHFAQLAENKKVTLFCIGTEWKQFILQRPNYWKKLIAEVRKIYSGQLTYAANWDEYLNVPFWNELDFIGVDAYFPLTASKKPKIAELKKALLPLKSTLSELSDSLDKPILFTEYGFRSRDYAANKPWEADKEGTENMQGQVNGYRAFYETFWNENFIAGGFLWKWFSNHTEVGGIENNGFTPQNKPVEKIISGNYQ